MVDTRVCVEGVVVLEEPEHEVRGEGRHRQRPAGAHRARHAFEDAAISVERRPGAAGEPEGALAQRDGRIELRVEG